MILSKTEINQQKSTCLKLKFYKQKMKKFIFLFNYLKNSKKNIKKLPVNLKRIYLQTTNKTQFVEENLDTRYKIYNENLINYIINIVLSQTNTIVNITDVSGNVKLSFSAGLINLSKTQKKSQPMALIKIFKMILLKAKFLNNQAIALHFKNTNYYHESIIIKLLKTKLFIKSVQNLNLIPHNGCRPKKIRRIKRRTKRMVLK